MIRCDMRTSVVSALALALACPPQVVHAGEWSPEQEAAMTQIMALQNRGALDDAVTLARQEFARTDASKGFRRAVAREGKAAAVKVFERDRGTPRAAEAVTALCVAVDLMRTYQAELMESDNDRIKIPLEVTRLEGMATSVAAPCAPIPAHPPPAPQPPRVAAKPKPTQPTLAGSNSQPRLGVDRKRSWRVRVGVGAGLMTTGVGLLAGMTAVFIARRSDDAKIAAVGALAVAEDRPLTDAENADVAIWDTRYARLDNTGKVLGTLAGLSVLAGILVMVVPPKRRGAQARLRPLGAGVLINF